MKREEIKLIVCDIDDTLIHKELHLNERIRSVIREVQDRGIWFTLATGRMPYRAEIFARESELKIPYIANNGSILYDNGKMIDSRMLDARILKDLLRGYMRVYPEFTVVFSYPDKECPLTKTNWIAERTFKYAGYDEILGDTDLVWEQQVHKIYVLDENKTGLIGKLAQEMELMKGRLSFFQYGEYSIEIVAEGCSKASGLKALLKHLNLSAGQVMAVGDHTNDIEMVTMAGIGVAVANADQKLKAVADYVTEKERAEGVEEAIHRFLPY